MTQILSLRVPDQMLDRLDKYVKKIGKGMTRTQAGIILLEESLRESEFAFIEYRDSPIGRQPYMKGSGLAIWEVIMIAKSYDMDAERMSKDYPYPVENIKGAFSFYEAFREETDQAIEGNNIGYEGLKRLLPNLQLFEVSTEEYEGESVP